MAEISLDKIVNLCKRRGFIFPGSEIYGGLANSWDYGPLGVELKNNIKKLWWKMFVQERMDVVGLDSAILMNSKVWEASGHIETFNDPLVECKKCHKRFRVDGEMTSEHLPNEIFEHIETEHKKEVERGTTPFDFAKINLADKKQFNLMLKTNLGPAADEGSQVYLRPETAQGMFVDFKQVLETTRQRVPFGIAQIGKSFRNEITPGNFIFRTREFEIMEIEYFIHPDKWQEHFEHWLNEQKRWIKAVGIDEARVKYVEIAKEDLAHYSKRTVDTEFVYPFGQKELYGIAYRTDFDLKNHEKHSGQELKYRDPITNEEYIPHVIEPTWGADRTVLAVLLSAYTESEARSGKSEAVHETEITLRLPKELAPIKIAILPLSKKEELTKPAEEIFKRLCKHWMCMYDETASIGKRYRRQDEIGTPYCITVDFDTLEDKSVTIRDRDTMAQERVKIDELVEAMKLKLNF
ncbi:MAG: glycine--tRNA ligase [Candidatus Doudnabacteria bacterium RIFCSPHIGHO2_02_FULL_46_11]|uniref:Glycine--tRNA ligase n=1 Tax=Candidatus Doudnabacteria bacterium RIFCSPHIGHO2_02_FULL_46_11 TaxID=1817832 RepID=A0A1F5P4C9_9BACT|nr:MAG: glycine--tRNA ligase [Candidatus Doudnabacteria bacterium RIFCSPHIGHO2_02_FULL_46_11]